MSVYNELKRQYLEYILADFGMSYLLELVLVPTIDMHSNNSISKFGHFWQKWQGVTSHFWRKWGRFLYINLLMQIDAIDLHDFNKSYFSSIRLYLTELWHFKLSQIIYCINGIFRLNEGKALSFHRRSGSIDQVISFIANDKWGSGLLNQVKIMYLIHMFVYNLVYSISSYRYDCFDFGMAYLLELVWACMPSIDGHLNNSNLNFGHFWQKRPKLDGV